MADATAPRAVAVGAWSAQRTGSDGGGAVNVLTRLWGRVNTVQLHLLARLRSLESVTDSNVRCIAEKPGIDPRERAPGAEFIL